MADLKGKTLIVTGASRGIGRDVALALAWRGVNLVLSARSADLLEEVRSACEGYGVQAVAVPGSAAKTDVAEALVKSATDIGGFYGFIHVAGVLHPGPTVWEVQPDEYDQVLDASVRAAHQLVRLAYPPLLGQDNGGLAVFFGSGAAERAQPGIGVYCVAKAAEEHLMRQVAEETDKVTAFVYRPGIVETRMQVDARSATGGAADRLQAVFRPWKEQGMLLTPEQSAAGLIRLLEGDLRTHHGAIRDIRDRQNG